jgi:membrane fusion protein (multidrug efflux system)
MNTIGSWVSLIACLSLASCGGQNNGVTSAAVQTLQQVEVTAVESQKLSTTERLPAELVPYESVAVYAKETGFVKSIRVDRGSTVKQGEIIAQLEAPELVARRAQADANFQSAEAQLAAGEAKLSADRATYQHMEAASKTPGVVAANDLDIARKALQSDEANVNALKKTAVAAEENLKAVSELESYLNITAPFDGQVTTRYVHPGALVGPASGPGAMTPIVTIETTMRHRLVVPVPENEVADIPEGTMVSFTVPSFPDRAFRAPIARVSHDVDLKTRTMPVELDVRDPRAELVPGMFCEAEWPVRRSYATLFVPVSAVASDLQRSFVIRVRQGKAEWVDVTTGVTANGKTEVFGDLQIGDLVVLTPTDALRSGTSVSIKESAR